MIEIGNLLIAAGNKGMKDLVPEIDRGIMRPLFQSAPDNLVIPEVMPGVETRIANVNREISRQIQAGQLLHDPRGLGIIVLPMLDAKVSSRLCLVQNLDEGRGRLHLF